MPTPPEAALRALKLGAVAVALAALPFKLFELDRFFVPKELVLHLVAAAIAVLVLARVGTGARRRPEDLALGAFLALSALSAAFAPNGWMALRALAVSLSGATLFWGARALARAGHDRPVLAAAALATVVAAATSLLQAYGGIETTYFSVNRAPGGTFGNRNFVAHLAAIGTPLVALATLRARRAPHALLGALGLGILACALVLSRSRAAWLALAACVPPLVIAAWRALQAMRAARPVPTALDPASTPITPRRLGGRMALLALAASLGGTAAVSLPNTLDWRSESPYLDSAKGLVDYKGGSGRGRLKQWSNSARMTLAHPLLGVGPGNWSVRYPRYAPADDPSLLDDGMTANPWPSSDWVAILSERGPLAAAAIAWLLLRLALAAHSAVWRPTDPMRALLGGVLGATIAATVVVGTFDAVLLLAAPSFVVWTALGALAGVVEPHDETALHRPRPGRRLVVIALAGAAVLAAARSGAQWAAMALFTTGRQTAIETAARLDPGSYRIRLRAAELAARRGRCTDVRTHAAAAHALYPEASAPRRVLGACGGRRRS